MTDKEEMIEILDTLREELTNEEPTLRDVMRRLDRIEKDIRDLRLSSKEVRYIPYYPPPRWNYPWSWQTTGGTTVGSTSTFGNYTLSHESGGGLQV